MLATRRTRPGRGSKVIDLFSALQDFRGKQEYCRNAYQRLAQMDATHQTNYALRPNGLLTHQDVDRIALYVE